MKKDKVDSAILIVLIAGIFWSFGALVVRFIEDAQSVPWQYLFFRGFTIFILINFYLYIFYIQIICYLFGLMISPVRYFLQVNFASLLAIIDWLLGRKQDTWEVIR